MFNKLALVNVYLDKKILKKMGEVDCTVECIPTIRLLPQHEQEEVEECFEKISRLISKSYLMFMEGE